eukprot:scaffold1371_cov400-Prasinococcus_capsulatus_cf.AAC.5
MLWVAGAVVVLLLFFFLCCRFTCCGVCCRKKASAYKARISDEKCRFWTLVVVALLLLAAGVIGVVVGLTGSTKISTSLSKAVGNTDAEVDDMVNKVRRIGGAIKDVDVVAQSIGDVLLSITQTDVIPITGLKDTIVKAMQMIDDVAGEMTKSAQDLQKEVDDIAEDVKEIIDYVNDVEDARHTVFIASVVVVCTTLVAVMAALFLRHRCTSVVVGVLLVLVLAASVVMLVAYICYGLVTGDGCATLEIYSERLSVMHSVWNINEVFEAGVYTINEDVQLACEPARAKTLIEEHFECPDLPGVLQLYAAGRFAEFVVCHTESMRIARRISSPKNGRCCNQLMSAADTVIFTCADPESLFTTQSSPGQVCSMLTDEETQCTGEQVEIACNISNALDSVKSITTELISLLTCEPVADVVDVLVVDVCGENMEGIYLSFVGYLVAIIALVLALVILIYYLGRYLPRDMQESADPEYHHSSTVSGRSHRIQATKIVE